MIKLSIETQLGTLIENQFSDKYLFSINRRNFEQLGYKTSFLKEFDDTFDKNDTLYIITGTDSGMMVKQLLKTPPEKGSAYVFIDFPEVIEQTKSQYNLDGEKRIIVSTEECWEEEAKKIGLEIYFTINKVKRVKSFAAQYYHLNEYIFLSQAIEDKANHLIWQYQSQLGSKTFTQKQLENLAENHTPAILLQNYFKGKSALILAGGPSLDDSIEWIEKNQEHYIVIAVTRIARRLLKTKIKPDIFISVDPYPANFEASKEVFNYEKESLLVHQYHLSPMILGNWLGINLYMGDLFPWKTPLNIENLSGVGPTVTNSAILYAIKMGIKEQILFGVDLCYSPEGFTHAIASNEHDAGPEINSISQTVITNNGNKAETNSAYFEAIETIEKLAELAIEHGGKVYNPSPNSVKMINVEYISLENIHVETKNTGISEFLKNQFLQNENSEFKIRHYQKILKELNQVNFKVNKIEELANKALAYNDKFFAGDNPSENFKFKLKMDKLEKELENKSLKPFTDLSKKFGIHEFLYFLNPDKDRSWTNEEIKQSGDTYYKALRTGAIELARHIFTAINRTEIRLLENKKLIIDDDLIKRHLNKFDKSYLLDRQIENQKNNLNKNIKTYSEKVKREQLIYLSNLESDKQDTIKSSKDLYSTFHKKDHSLGRTDIDRLHNISLYLLILQNDENYQTRRLYITSKNNSDLLITPKNTLIVDEQPDTYIQRHYRINNTLQKELKTANNLKKIINQIANITENHTPITVLEQYFKEKSALILTDIESLQNHREWIEQNQNNYIVIALSFLAKEIFSTGIKPDIFIANSSNEATFETDKAIMNYEHESLLIRKNSFLPKITGNWLGISLYTGELFPWKSKLNSNCYLNTTTNDALDLIHIAQYIGIKKQIIFLSQNVLSENTKELKEFISHTQLDINTPISISFKTYGIKNVSLNDLSIPERQDDVKEFIQQQKEINERNQLVEKHYHSVLTELNIIYKKLKTNLETNDSFNLILLSKQFKNEQGFFCNDDALTVGQKQLTRYVFTAINRIESRLLEENQVKLTDDLINRHLLNNTDSILLDKLSNFHPVFKNRKAVYHEYFQNKNERKKATHFSIIMMQNGLEHHFRRVIKLQKKNPGLYSDKKQIIFSNKTAHDITASHIKTSHGIFSDNGHDSNSSKFDGLEIKLYNLFLLKDVNAITRIIDGIALLQKSNTYETSYYHLASGYRYELNNEVELAIDEYGQADSSKTIESALKRIAFITLENNLIEYAHNTLTLLSEISPDYLPQLAELYLLTKNYKDALEIYTQYLDFNSSDTAILFKVAKLYESQDIIDGAEFIYQQILKLDPENLLAIKQLNTIKNKEGFSQT